MNHPTIKSRSTRKRKISNADEISSKEERKAELSDCSGIAPMENHCDYVQKSSKQKLCNPVSSTLIPLPSYSSSTSVAESVDLPLRIHAGANSSERLFVESTSKRLRSSSHSNATFAFVQRSGKEFIFASIKRLSQMIMNTMSSDLANSKECEACATTVYEDFIGLHGYAQDEYYKIILSRANAIQVIIDALAAFPDNELVQASGILLIGSLCTKSLPNALKLVEYGGLRNIIYGLKKHPNNSHVCSITVNCLLRVMKASKLAVLFLSKMHDSVSVIESISDDLLTYESPRNREIVLNMIGRIPQSEKSIETTCASVPPLAPR
jgi:hypothetical protein